MDLNYVSAIINKLVLLDESLSPIYLLTKTYKTR
jgi:hypothetical protein